MKCVVGHLVINAMGKKKAGKGGQEWGGDVQLLKDETEQRLDGDEEPAWSSGGRGDRKCEGSKSGGHRVCV